MPLISADQIATLSVPNLDAAVREKCKELRRRTKRATPEPWHPLSKAHPRGFTLFQQSESEVEGEANLPLACLARNTFLAHLDAMKALAGWRCGECDESGIVERNYANFGDSQTEVSCPSCAPIVTIKREWLGKMMEVGNG